MASDVRSGIGTGTRRSRRSTACSTGARGPIVRRPRHTAVPSSARTTAKRRRSHASDHRVDRATELEARARSSASRGHRAELPVRAAVEHARPWEHDERGAFELARRAHPARFALHPRSSAADHEEAREHGPREVREPLRAHGCSIGTPPLARNPERWRRPPRSRGPSARRRVRRASAPSWRHLERARQPRRVEKDRGAIEYDLRDVTALLGVEGPRHGRQAAVRELTPSASRRPTAPRSSAHGPVYLQGSSGAGGGAGPPGGSARAKLAPPSPGSGGSGGRRAAISGT